MTLTFKNPLRSPDPHLVKHLHQHWRGMFPLRPQQVSPCAAIDIALRSLYGGPYSSIAQDAITLITLNVTPILQRKTAHRWVQDSFDLCIDDFIFVLFRGASTLISFQ